MIKHIILLFNLLGLFLYQLLFQANVNVSQSVPSNADPGSSFVVQVTINKADVSGFAKFQEDLPAGFTAEAVDKQGATVLSSGNAIKFIWASLPADATFKISFKVTVDASVSGSQTLAGKFLYVVNNERQESDAAPASINIGNSAAAAVTPTQPAANTTQPDNSQSTASNNTQPSTNTTQPATTQPDNSQPAANTSQPVVNNTQPATTQPDNSQPTANTSQPVVNNTQPDNSTQANTTPANTNTASTSTTPAANPGPTINITRAYSASSVAPAADLTVTLTIHKGNLTGFAKLEETIPNSLFVTEGDKQGSSFTFVDNRAKFVWLNLPADSVITVSYKISVGSTVSGDQSIPGEFSYLLDNNALKYEVAATSFSVQNTTAPVANTTQPATTQPIANTTQPDNAQPATTQPIANTTQPDNTQPATTQPIANTTQPDNTQPATSQPIANTTQPDNAQPATSQPIANTTQPDNAQPATSQPIANTTQPNTTQPATTQPVTNTTQPDNNQSASASNSITPSIPAASGAVKYRVQIMALHNPVKTSYLARQYSISETINQEMLEGYTKYTVGSFNEYKSVRDHREEIKSKGVQGPFVVAYNGGKRVTVQEALMITHQQWYR